MNKAQKEFIEQAKPYELGKPLRSIFLIPAGKLYTGFWGKNGYNNIIIVGWGGRDDDNYYIVNKEYQCDVVNFMSLGSLAQCCNIDVPHKLNCILMGFGKPICFKDNLSTMMPEVYNG